MKKQKFTDNFVARSLIDNNQTIEAQFLRLENF